MRDLTHFENEVLALIVSEPNCGICLQGIFNSTVHMVREMQDVVDAVKELIKRDLVHFRYSERMKSEMYLPGPRPPKALTLEQVEQAKSLGRQAAHARYHRDDSRAAFHRESLVKLRHTIEDRESREQLELAHCDAYRAAYQSMNPASRPN